MRVSKDQIWHELCVKNLVGDQIDLIIEFEETRIMNDKFNDTLITLFPTLIMKCSDFLNKSEIDEIFEILKSKPKEQHDTLAIGGKSSHGMGMSNDLISPLGLESRIQKLDMYTNSLKLQKVT